VSKTPEFTLYEFANGIRMVHKQVAATQIAHCGYIINAGARDEEKNATGIAHFIEHMLFKGTAKRKSSAILSRMDEVGAELNAYTTKEQTSIYSSFPALYLKRAVELLTDICFHSTFPKHEMEKEKKVVLEEYEMYLDTPEESIYDEFNELLFPKHPLGNNILGTPETISKFNQKQITHFIAKNYLPQHIVFSYVGTHPFNEVKKILERSLHQVRFASGQRQRQKVIVAKPFVHTAKKSYTQAHCIMGTRAYHNKHKHRAALLLLSNYIGGPALNSRLNLSVREKYGYTYHIESSYSPYCDTGVFSIYMGTDQKYLGKCTEAIHKELLKLSHQPLSAPKLQAAKKQFIGQISMAEESRSNLMLALGKSLNDYNKIDTLPQVYKKIEAVTAAQLLEISNEILLPQQLSSLVYLPKK
jgi:predicted Zn-dependent peptidase